MNNNTQSAHKSRAKLVAGASVLALGILAIAGAISFAIYKLSPEKITGSTPSEPIPSLPLPGTEELNIYTAKTLILRDMYFHDNKALHPININEEFSLGYKHVEEEDYCEPGEANCPNEEVLAMQRHITNINYADFEEAIDKTYLPSYVERENLLENVFEVDGKLGYKAQNYVIFSNDSLWFCDIHSVGENRYSVEVREWTDCNGNQYDAADGSEPKVQKVIWNGGSMPDDIYVYTFTKYKGFYVISDREKVEVYY